MTKKDKGKLITNKSGGKKLKISKIISTNQNNERE